MLLHLGSARSAELLAEVGVVEHVGHRFDPFFHGRSLPQVHARLDVQPFQALGRADHGLAHRQGFQDLILDSPGDPQGHHDHGGVGQVRAHVGDLSGQHDPGQSRQPLNRRSRVASHQREPRPRAAAVNFRPNLPGEPVHSVDIGPIVQRPDEHAPKRGSGIPGVGRAEILQVDAVADRVDALGRAKPPVQLHLLVADQGDGPGAPGQRLLQPPQSPTFEAENQPLQPPRLVGVVEPLLAVHVHQVHHDRHPLEPGGVEVLHHARAEDHHGVEPRLLGPTPDGASEPG